MEEIRIIEVKQSVFEDNNKDAEELRKKLKEEKTFLLNLMSSPGSGKTTTLKALAKELGPYNITVNDVAPGIVMRPQEGDSSDRALKTNVLGKKCTAADIAELVAFLASDKAGFITGQTYVCDGGRSLSMKGTD